MTGIGDLKRQLWQNPELKQPLTKTSVKAFEAFASRLLLTGPLPAHQKVVAVAEMERGNLPDDSPVGTLAAAVSRADGRVFLACGGPDSNREYNAVHSEDPLTGQRDSNPYLGHSEAILDVAVSPDGRLLATASSDNTARIWAIPFDKSKVVTLRGHSGDVNMVTFSPDSQYVLTISRQDGTARVWEIDGGDPVYLIGTRRAGLNSASLNDPSGPRQYTDDVVAAAFSPDGKLVITANGDGSARVYPLETLRRIRGPEKSGTAPAQRV